jgi:NAD(P)-dependent dehydrogenase (short-subunit alcohol dehydrogenase family)
MANASLPVQTPFDERSTAEEVLADVDLSGRRAIVTGASSGIGTETARVLALRGAAVTLTARDLAAGERAAAEIRQSTGNRAVDVLPLELADPDSVAALVDRWDGPLDILCRKTQPQSRRRDLDRSVGADSRALDPLARAAAGTARRPTTPAASQIARGERTTGRRSLQRR